MWQLAFFQIEGDSLFTHFQLVGCTEFKAAFRVSGLTGGKSGSGERLTPAPPRAQMGASVTASRVKCHAGSSGPDARHLACCPDGWEQEDTVYRVCPWKKSTVIWPSATVAEKKRLVLWWPWFVPKTGYRCLVINKAVGRPTAYANAAALHASSCYIWTAVQTTLQEIIFVLYTLTNINKDKCIYCLIYFIIEVNDL